EREFGAVVLDHRLERQIGVFEAPGIVLDFLADAPALPGQARIDPEFLPRFYGELEMEDANRLDLHAEAAIAAVLHAHDPAFERMDALRLEHDLEHGHELRRFGRVAPFDRAMPPRHRLDVLWRVIGAPGIAIRLI